jgi:uncharacterized protein YcbX
MRVLEIWRYPVKSLQGERLAAAELDDDGVIGDRRYAIFDLDTGFGLTARRVPELLFASARLVGDDVEITLPDGTVAAGDDALSKWLDRAVELRDCTFEGKRSYEVPLDIETEADDSWVAWNGPRGAFHDSTRTRVSLLSTGTIGEWNPRRFRANVLLDGSGEDAWVGSSVTNGDVVLSVEKQIDRCVMVARPQPGGIERNLEILKTINSERASFLAVGALVSQAGALHIGDELRVVRSDDGDARS